MSRQPPGRGNGPNNGGAVARGAGYAAAKGAGLIGVAVIIGIVLLNVVEHAVHAVWETARSRRPRVSSAVTRLQPRIGGVRHV